MIEGRLDFHQWEAQDGSKRSKHRITVESFVFVDSKGQDDSPPPQTREDKPPTSGSDDQIPF